MRRITRGAEAATSGDRHSGYQVGGTSPFGIRKVTLVYLERTIADLLRIHINGGGKPDAVDGAARPGPQIS
jgi:prolyl-tRNA editing enzyme YbaK/EbsC (Cys-tRNA(Pro) deacylase)